MTASYCFEVTIYEESNPGVFGIANIEIKVRDIPNGGYCKILSNPIESFIDDLSISCPGWSTDLKV
jgi:hypothetical protein